LNGTEDIGVCRELRCPFWILTPSWIFLESYFSTNRSQQEYTSISEERTQKC
jgi:hypothetical protein